MEKKIKVIGLFPNNDERSIQLAQLLGKKLNDIGYIINNDYCDLAIAFGGDGSFLRMVKTCLFSEDKYYVGVNTGTLGFAQEIYPNEVDLFLEVLKSDTYKVEDIGVSETSIETLSSMDTFYSLNEFILRDRNLKTTYLNVFIDDQFLEMFVGDGISVATSFGSTAYNLNLGGSIVYNDLYTMQITPIAPQDNKAHRVLKNSVIVPGARSIKLVPTHRSKDLLVSSDGDDKIYDDVLEVSSSVKKKIKLLRMNEYDYTKKIHDKFL